MGAYVKRNGKEYYKADNGKLYQDYTSAAAAAKSSAPKSNTSPVLDEANKSLYKAGEQQRKEDNGFFSDFNVVEAIASAALNNPMARAVRGGVRMAGDAIGLGAEADAMNNAIRAVTGDRSQASPSSYTGAGRTALADGIDGAISRGQKPNAAGYYAVDYPDYKGTAEGLITGRMFGRKNADGSYEVSPDERYDFNASSADQSDRAAYKENLDGAMSSAYEDFKNAEGGKGKLSAGLRMLANAPDYLNFYTGAGERGMNIGGKFERPNNAPAPVAPPVTPTAPSIRESAYSVKSGDTLSSIARSKGTTVDALVKMNNIADINRISVGQQIQF